MDDCKCQSTCLGFEEIKLPCVCSRKLDLPNVEVVARRCHDPRFCVHLIHKSNDGSSFEVMMTSREAQYMKWFLNDFGRVCVEYSSDLKYLCREGYNLRRNENPDKNEGCYVKADYTDWGERIFRIYDVSVDWSKEIGFAPKNFFQLIHYIDGLLKLTADVPRQMTMELFSQLPFSSVDVLQKKPLSSCCPCIIKKGQPCVCKKVWRNANLSASVDRCHSNSFCVHLYNENDQENVLLTSDEVLNLLAYLPRFARCLLDPNDYDRFELYSRKRENCSIIFKWFSGNKSFLICSGRFYSAINMSPRQFFNFARFLRGVVDFTDKL